MTSLSCQGIPGLGVIVSSLCSRWRRSYFCHGTYRVCWSMLFSLFCFLPSVLAPFCPTFYYTWGKPCVYIITPWVVCIYSLQSWWKLAKCPFNLHPSACTALLCSLLFYLFSSALLRYWIQNLEVWPCGPSVFFNSCFHPFFLNYLDLFLWLDDQVSHKR